MYSLQCEINKREIKGINYTGQTCRHSKWQIKEHEADSNLVFRKTKLDKRKRDWSLCYRKTILGYAIDGFDLFLCCFGQTIQISHLFYPLHLGFVRDLAIFKYQ